MGFDLFLGLQLMSDGLRPLRDLPEFVNMFQAFQANSYLGVLKVALVGAAITGIVQSSAATLGITITLASQGLIDYPTAVALVLGENVERPLQPYWLRLELLPMQNGQPMLIL